jgi:hypothetical protein
MRLGTAASLAGVHIIETDSIANVAMAAHPTISAELSVSSVAVGMVRKNVNRSRSQTTMV